MSKNKKATATARVLPTINKDEPSEANEPMELNKALQGFRITLSQAATGKRNFDKGFAYTVANLWTLFQVGHFEYTSNVVQEPGLKELVRRLHDGAEPKSGALEYVFNKTGMYKAIPDLIEPEKISKKHASADEWNTYQGRKKTWTKTYGPVSNIVSRAIVAVAYLADPKRKHMVGRIETAPHTGCLFLMGPVFGNDKVHMPHNIVPYDKACGTLEEHARNAFTLKRRTTTQSGAAVSIKSAMEAMVNAIKTDPKNFRSQTVLVSAMNAVKQGVETMEVNWQSTSPIFREAVRDCLYTLMSWQQGIIANDIATEALKQAERWEPPKEDKSEAPSTLEEAQERMRDREAKHDLDRAQLAGNAA